MTRTGPCAARTGDRCKCDAWRKVKQKVVRMSAFWHSCRGSAAYRVDLRRGNALDRWHSPPGSANSPGGGWISGERNPVERSAMKFRPLHDRIVVKRITAEEKTAGGIIIPDTAKEKPMEGEVVAAGPGARNEQGAIVALDVKAGDRVLFGKWSRHRGEARWRGAPDHEGERHHGHHRGQAATAEGRLKQPCATPERNQKGRHTHGSQGRTVRRRRPPAHAARRGHPRRRR